MKSSVHIFNAGIGSSTVSRDLETGPVICSTNDLVELHKDRRLYLRPIARANLTVQVPALRSGGAVSNWEVMEKLRGIVRPPAAFLQLKVVKSTLEFVRFQAELADRADLKQVLGSLDGQVIKLSGFPESLRVRATEAKLCYPSRHDWDAFFRDARDMDEMKPGERPDTVHILGLPTRWFADLDASVADPMPRPSEQALKSVFQVFGDVRCVDIPMLDPVKRGSGQTGCFHQGQLGLTFEAFIQYREYMGFVRAMDAFRGMKLVYLPLAEGDAEAKMFTADIKVDFDRKQHLSDQSIRRRRMERERFYAQQKNRLKVEEDERLRREQEDLERERRRLEEQAEQTERRKAREEKRRRKAEERRRQLKEVAMQRKIAMEERKILIAMRKLETIRLLSHLMKGVKTKKEKELVEQRERELEVERRRQVEEERHRKSEKERKRMEMEKRKRERLLKQEQELREKILKNLLDSEAKKDERERERLRRSLSGRTRLRSTLSIRSLSPLSR